MSIYPPAHWRANCHSAARPSPGQSTTYSGAKSLSRYVSTEPIPESNDNETDRNPLLSQSESSRACCPLPPQPWGAVAVQRCRHLRPYQQLGLPPAPRPGQGQVLRGGAWRPGRLAWRNGGGCQHQRELLLSGLFRRAADRGHGRRQDVGPQLHSGAAHLQPADRRREVCRPDGDGRIRPAHGLRHPRAWQMGKGAFKFWKSRGISYLCIHKHPVDT